VPATRAAPRSTRWSTSAARSPPIAVGIPRRSRALGRATRATGRNAELPTDGDGDQSDMERRYRKLQDSFARSRCRRVKLAWTASTAMILKAGWPAPAIGGSGRIRRACARVKCVSVRCSKHFWELRKFMLQWPTVQPSARRGKEWRLPVRDLTVLAPMTTGSSPNPSAARLRTFRRPHRRRGFRPPEPSPLAIKRRGGMPKNYLGRNPGEKIKLCEHPFMALQSPRASIATRHLPNGPKIYRSYYEIGAGRTHRRPMWPAYRPR
jgi:hypothetical protein